MNRFDVIVLGLGGMGSSTAYHLAGRGARVLGLERFALAHDHGSSHGETRLTRKAYFESPDYVPLLERAFDLWDALGREAGRPLLHRAGLLLLGEGSVQSSYARAQAIARHFGIETYELGGDEVRARFPAFEVPSSFRGLYEPGAGYLDVEHCVKAHAHQARARGAELHFEECVTGFSATAAGVRVTTNAAVYEAGALVVTAGPWAPELLAEVGIPLEVHRVVQSWFRAPERFREDHGMPCFAFDVEGAFVYGFPALGGCMKIADHRAHAPIAGAGAIDRAIHPEDVATVTRFVERFFPAIEGGRVASKTCLYTMTPDEHFVIDRHPRHSNVHFACGFSGHGFKFSSVVGEILADLATTGSTKHAIDFLRLRWGASPHAH
jgi:monomeric sarcosine oxidase